ncbi:Uncharacterized conserved protein [Phaffia rhodozyma]|uniref:COX assembly mitochondrial protein n=1 Tax=Phaffia rhodozyma TaxID=264483 RepID=A0A0F7SSC7_PHARH|nr:Uncharacterized conserved protein [Phaffia rhodozyma]
MSQPESSDTHKKFTWRQEYQPPEVAGMSALSRREEEALFKDAKASARDACREYVAAFAACAAPRLVSIAWACRPQQRAMNECMSPLMTDKALDKLRMEYLSEKHREQYRSAPVEKRDGSRSPFAGK